MPWRRSPLSVCVCVQLCQFSQDDGFCGEDDGFLVKMKDFLLFLRLRQKSFVFATLFACVRHMLQCLHCILMSEAPTLSMCGHTNEGIPSTEHVHMLHWACADIIMRGNPLTDMTDNTEDGNTN